MRDTDLVSSVYGYALFSVPFAEVTLVHTSEIIVREDQRAVVM